MRHARERAGVAMNSKIHILGASGASIAAVAVAGALLVPQVQAEKPPLAYSAPDEVPNWDHSVETPTKQVPIAAPVKVKVVYSAPIHKEKTTNQGRHRHRKPGRSHFIPFRAPNRPKVPSIQVPKPTEAPTPAPTTPPLVGGVHVEVAVKLPVGGLGYTQPPTL
jgi:hypothetical protein